MLRPVIGRKVKALPVMSEDQVFLHTLVLSIPGDIESAEGCII